MSLPASRLFNLLDGHAVIPCGQDFEFGVTEVLHWILNAQLSNVGNKATNAGQ